MSPKKLIPCLLLCGVTCINDISEGNGLSKLGFYSSPDVVISSLNRHTADSREQFMLALAHRKKGNLKLALFHLSNSCFKYARDFNLRLFPNPVYLFVRGFHVKSEYYNDAVAEIADIFFQYREFEYVIKFSDLLERERSALFRDTMILEARSLAALQRQEEATEKLLDLLRVFEDGESRSLIHIRLASLYESKDLPAKAVEAYLKVIEDGQSSWQAGIAAERIVFIAKNQRLSLSPEESLLLCRALYHTRRYRQIVKILGALLEPAGKSPSASLVRECCTLSIRSLVRAGSPGEADTLIQKAEKYNMTRDELLYVKADELWESGKKAAAVSLYAEIKVRASGEIGLGSFKKVVLYMADRRPAGYEKTLMEYQSRFPRDGLSEYVLWIVGAEAVKSREKDRAVALFEQGTAQFPRGEYSDRMRFWLYKLYREIGKTAEAEKKFRELSVYNPDSSYTWRVLQEHAQARDEARLEEEFDQGLKKRDPSLYLHSHLLLLVMQKDLEKRDQRIRKLPRSATGAFFTLGQALDGFEVRRRNREQLARLEKYFAVGHADGISRELEILPPDDRAQADKNIALAHFGSRYNHHYFSVYFTLEALRHAGLQENIALLPASTVRRLLPFSFGECTTRYSMESRIPATEILAVMKAESLFNHRAVSSARAVGLMQLMPSTARDIARRMNVKKYDLIDPCTSIRFGAHYLSWLDRMFNGRFEYVVAAYNAGAGNVEKWRNKAMNDIDYFTEFLAFEETRYYILRTNKFLAQYTAVADSFRYGTKNTVHEGAGHAQKR